MDTPVSNERAAAEPKGFNTCVARDAAAIPKGNISFYTRTAAAEPKGGQACVAPPPKCFERATAVPKGSKQCKGGSAAAEPKGTLYALLDAPHKTDMRNAKGSAARDNFTVTRMSEDWAMLSKETTRGARERSGETPSTRKVSGAMGMLSGRGGMSEKPERQRD